MERVTQPPAFRFDGYLPLVARWWLRVWTRYRLTAVQHIADELRVAVVRLDQPTRWVVTVRGRIHRGAPLSIRGTDAHLLDALTVAVDLFVRRAAVGATGRRSVVCVSPVLEATDG